MNTSNHIEQAVGKLHVATRPALDERIFADAAAALERATAGVRQPARPRMRHTTFDRRAVRWAALIAVAGIVVAGGVTVWKEAVNRRQPGVHVAPSGPNMPSPIALRVVQRQEIDALYAARDVDGLIQALNTSRMADRIRVARYLGEIGDMRAIAALAPLVQQWQGDPAENPFAQAIRQIEARTRPGEPNGPDSGQSWRDEARPGSELEPVLTGTIMDAETGEPIPGVTVQLMSNASYTATTDSNGVYGFDRIDKDGLYYIRLNAPEYITPAEWEEPWETVRLRAGVQVRKDYALERGGKLVITTLDENGRPVEDVGVYAACVSDDMGRGLRHPSWSDNNGVVVVDGLRADTYLVTAAHPDFALAGERVSLEEPKQVKSLVLNLEPGKDVAGVATCSDGLPASGWSIEAKPLWWNSVITWPRSAPVAEDGTFLLRHVLPGPHRLEVLIPEKGGMTRGVRLTDVNLPPESGLLDLKLPLPSPQSRFSIAGTVKFTGSEPYEQGFRIHAVSAAGNSGDAYVAAGQQDFIITDLAPGLYDLEITAAGQSKEFQNIQAPSEGLVLEVAVPEILRVHGRVVDAQTHRPVTAFQLRVEDGRTGDYSTVFGLLGELKEEGRRISDPNGAFEVRTYGPQCYVVVRAEGYGEKTSDDLYRDSNEPVVIELGPPVVARGVVVDEAGLPVEGVTVHSSYPGSADEPAITTTDKEGRFTLDDLPAEESDWWFVFRHPDYARVLKQLASGPNGIAEVKIVLSRGGTVEGCLYDAQGKPLGRTVLYFMDEGDFGYWKQGRARLGSVTTDGNGFYRIERLPEELCYVCRGDPDSQLGVVRTVVMPVCGRTRRFDIGGPWKVAGRLLQEGQPVANTQLLATYGAGAWQGFNAFTMADSDGRFAFYGLPTGQRSIYWAAPGVQGVDRWIMLGTFEFHGGVDLDLGDCEAGLAEVTVEVAMEDAAMPPEAWSIVLEEHDELRFGGRGAGVLQPRSESSAPYVFSHVPAGRFEALARCEGRPTVRVPFEIKAGQKTGKVLVTVPAGSAAISGQVISGTDQRPYLMLRRADQGITAEVPVGRDGTFQVKNLPPGRYIFGRTSYAWERTSTLAEVTLAPQERKTISIDLAQADAVRDAEGSLIVTVVTEDGVPLATPSVWLERAGRIIPPYFDQDDRKSFGGDPGPCMLHAEYPGYQPVRTAVELKSQQGRTTQDTLTPLVITMTRQ